jgi:tRNA pseudouridine38-40 synthase
VNLAALVEYDGTRFAGFQRQPADKGPTVQGEIETALARIAGVAQGRIEAAGRTDSGVHATGQVINAHVPDRLEPATWQRALNALLPPDIAVRAATRASAGFRARWDAQARRYRYRILCDPVRAPLRERFVWRLRQPLDVEAMERAATALCGEHDFGAFGSSPRDQPADGYRGHTVRTLTEATCRRVSQAGRGDEVECLFTANAFLTGMARRLVGTLALVGEGRLSVEGFVRILEARDKGHNGPTAPARGLCLVGVIYPAGILSWPANETARRARLVGESDESEDV